MLRRKVIQKPRINKQIRSPEVRLIDENGKQLGIKKIEEALAEARDKGLDLLEVSPNTNPPVCKLIDYGKYLYRKTKQEQKQKKLAKAPKLKTIKLSLRIGQHDLEIKIKRAEEFLKKRDKVKFIVFFKGREFAQVEQGKILLSGIITRLKDISKIEQEPIFEERVLQMMLAPK